MGFDHEHAEVGAADRGHTRLGDGDLFDLLIDEPLEQIERDAAIRPGLPGSPGRRSA